ncbi:MAG TPA: FecR family protein [Candidatus Cloacimonadota bacterium]|nr:FecR family protein [Candidatus Cloacimonadota bacterium]
MKKYMIAALLLCAILTLLADSGVAYLSANKGKVELTRNSQALKFKTGQILNSEDVLKTGGQSFAAYKFVDASSTVKVFANSVVKIKAYKEGKNLSKTVAVSKGNVYSSVKKNTGAYRVDTPGTVASVKGTGFLTGVSASEGTKYIVVDGTIEIEIKATGERKSLGAGKSATIDNDGNYEEYDTTPGEVGEIEELEDEAGEPFEQSKIRIPIQNAAGQTKYIEISY